ncbi:serine-rich adhesin for platelets-like isoform X1 [Biomphalaria glabrata]|uniref:Serine-rich adhesin for platelets-like isoform X1 n=1 Tax=Biomphalaria glabrata TaxID=6526 RepID=A0A9U8E6U5_BIOGL|nr:serine-rich adhesin for platelets-like isoform X1 [Biomphalaria glabrata]
MDGAMGQEEDVVEAVLTCEGDFHDPELFIRLEKFRHGLKELLSTEKHKVKVKKVEPWNSVKVTLTIPRDAATRLRQLAHSGNDSLRQMGVLSVQIQGDSQISLTIAGRNNEPTEFVLRAPALSTTTLGSDADFSVSTDLNTSPGTSNNELTRKNIVDYLRQGSALRQNASLFDSIMGGVGTSSPAISLGIGISQHSSSFQNPSLHSSSFRPNNISCMPVQNPSLRGSSLRNSFSFTKSTGAFHPPVPRLPASAGQSPVTKLMQPGNRQAGHNVPLSQVSYTNSNSHMALSTSISNLNPAGPLRLPASPSPSFHSQNALLPPPLSSSPTSALMMDLPPPPPYPHNNARPGKPVTASSPLLVNLLQTDPLMVAAGNASGNPNKPLSLGDSEAPPSKKKKRSKKSKDGLAKLTESLANNNPAFSNVFSNSGVDLNRITRVTEDSYTVNLQSSISLKDSSVDVAQSRSGAMNVCHIPDSFIPNFRPDSKPSFLPDRPFSESHTDNLSLSKFHLESNRSAIGISNVSSKHSDSNVREHSSKDLDPFNLEISAGKIINPYTGQLEPRDSVDMGPIGDNFATQILAKKAKEMDELNKITVPICSSHTLDVRVGSLSPSPVTLSNSTAGYIRSGGPFQVCNDRMNSVSPHRRNLISDGPLRDVKHSTPSTFYALPTRQDIVGPAVPAEAPTSTHQSPSVSHKSVSVKSAGVQRTSSSASIPVNGPSPSLSPSHLEFLENSLSSVASSTSSGSVIYPSSTSMSLPVTQISLSQTPAQQAMSVPAAVEAARVRPQSSAPSHQPRLTSSPSNASDRSPSLANIHNQAASTDTIGNTLGTKFSSPHLLNSFPEKHMDSLSGTESPPEKVSSEGDDNSNHSGLAADSLPENSGAAALIEHSGVKAENHDSGLGSSSERSDDTPSEPGDSEFRPTHTSAEGDDNKTQSAKINPATCKLDSKQSNSITVGYMMNPNENISQSKLLSSKYSSHLNMKVTCTPTRATTSLNMSHLSDGQLKPNDKQNGQQVLSSSNWPLDNINYQPSTTGLLIENSGDLVTGPKLNGPLSDINLETIFAAATELQQKKIRSMQKQSLKKDNPAEHMKLQAEVLEKISKVHQYAESTKSVSDLGVKNVTVDKEDAQDSFSRTVNLEEKVDHLIFDMEELVNGKTLGNGSVGLEGKVGSNITSIYSKRSSPVNVNMLNHIYAPGLPLPRRLTESVQRLVKPLPASESSAVIPSVRACKSPASGNSSRAASSANGSNSRVSFQSGTRSPGASMPKLVPNDKYSLLSGGLDLAGLSSLPYSSASTGDTLLGCKPPIPVLTADLSLKDTSLLNNPLSPTKIVFDAKSVGSKMLSQSYPPFKYRENSPHLLPEITDQNNLAQSSSFNFFPKTKFEIPNNSQESRHFTSIISQEQSLPQANRVYHETGGNVGPTKLALQSPAIAAKDNAHSSHDRNNVDISVAYSRHSSVSSPVMPVLHQGQQDLAVTLPSISSHHPNLSTLSEISALGSTTTTVAVSTTVSALGVPYFTGSSSTTVTTYKACSPGQLPTLYPIPTSSTLAGKAETTVVSSQTLLSRKSDSPTPPKLTRVSLPSHPPPLLSKSGYQLNRNLFENMQSDLLTHELASAPTLSSETATEWLSQTMHKSPEPEVTEVSLIDSETLTPKSGLSQADKSECKKPDNILRNSVLTANEVKNRGSVIIDQELVQNSLKLKTESEDNSLQTSLPLVTRAESLNSLDSVSETIASVAAGTVSSSSKLLPSLPLVKEPILEKIASTLGTTLSTMPKPLPSKVTLTLDENMAVPNENIDEEKDVDSSSVEALAVSIVAESASEPFICEESTKHGDIVNFVSSPGEPPHIADNSSAESSMKRVTRKRKSTHSEGDSRDAESDLSSSETTPVKQACNVQPTNKPTVKSSPAANSKMDTYVSKPFREVSSLRTYSKSSNFGNGDFHNKVTKITTHNSGEEKDSVRQPRPHRTSLSDGETNSLKEVKHLPSIDNKDTAIKDISKDSMFDSGDKFDGSVDDSSELKDSLHKENKSTDIEDQKEARNQRISSLDEKAKSGNKDLIDKQAVQGGDEGHRKNHRIKRQFYAYVPEKSIDQTYFDTPILSGRTRSKNKPAEQNAEPGSQDGTTTNDSNHLESTQLAPSGKGDVGLEGGSAKRPTRSVRAKDNPQDQSANKRRKVQQHR